MIEKLNSIWKHLLAILIGGVLLAALIIYNFLNNKQHLHFTITDKIAFGLVIVLGLHALFLLFLFVWNIIYKKYWKAIIFIIISIVLFIILHFSIGLLWLSSIGSVYTDDHH